ncbi:diguanylate cyclase [Pontibacter sp. JAM-7]|uniref:diguanylate cyclase n=1 Tax=Pontibacter sp. JAM-7 TaxID=3366581 RepID=UPI003AF7A71D
MKRLIRILITLAVLGTGSVLSLALYYMGSGEMDNQLKQQVEEVHQHVGERFKVFDELLAYDERQIQSHARSVLPIITETLTQQPFSAMQWTPDKLQDLAEQHQVDGIYVIDKNTSVVATNFLPDLGFELGTINEGFHQYLLDFFGTGRLEVDRINVSSQTGLITIYAYFSPEGSDYIFEVSYDVKKFLSRNRSTRYMNFIFGDFFTEITSTSPLLEHVDIYLVNNYSAFPFLQDTQPINLIDLPEIPEYEVIRQQVGNTLYFLSRADLNRSRLHSAEYLVIRTEFDLSPLTLLMQKMLSVSTLAILAVLGLAYILISHLFDRWIMHRIQRIVVALEHNAEADFTDTIPITRHDELGLIADHINKMSRRLSSREQQLREAQQHLEKRVAERTQDLREEVDARRKAESKLIEMATTDPLTGILNRRAFSDQAEKEVSRAFRYQRSLAVILLDLDHFKRINDTYGHLYGDKVLICTAELINTCLRSIDSHSRHGGEEFLVLLPETSEEEAVVLAERLRKALETLELEAETGTVRITASFGVACWEPGEHNLQQAINRADKALYQAKDQGRNRVVVYRPQTESCPAS